MSASNLENSASMHMDLIGPLASAVTAQDLIANGITQAQFQVDVRQKWVICPQGQRTTRFIQIKEGWRFIFPKQTCAICPVRSRCCAGKQARTIRISTHDESMQQARIRQKTDTFKQDYQ
jgi:hypothetical protein